MRKGWEYKKLGEVSVYPNKRIQISELNPQDYVGVENLQKNKAGIVFSDKLPNTDSAIVFSPNDILIGNIRPYLKKIWLADKSGGASGDVIIIRICTNDLMPMYLYRVLASDKFFEYANTFTKGAKMPRGDRNAIAKFIVPLPPKSTQLAIVSELDKINELIRLKKEQLKDFDNLAQSLFYEMFGEGKCLRKKLKDIVKIQSGQVSPLEEPYSEMIHVGPANIESNTGRLLNLKTAKEENLISGKYLFNSSMVLYSKIRPNLNKVTIPSFEGICSADMYPIIPLECIDKNFLLFLLKQKEFLTYAISNSGRANIPKINREALLNYEAILPPISLQRLFAQRIEQIEREKSEVQKSIQDLETLLASRMQYWFE